MPNPGFKGREAVLFAAVEAVNEALRAGHPRVPRNNRSKGAVRVAAEASGIDPATLRTRLAAAKRELNLEPDWPEDRPPEAPHIPPPAPEEAGTTDDLAAMLRKKPHTLDEIAEALNVTRGQALDMVDALADSAINVHRMGDTYSIEGTQAPAFTADELPVYKSRPDNTFLFGALGDNHLGNVQERLDVLDDLYDRFEAAGVDRVFNTGNWIDGAGRANFNLHELHTHGLDAQIDYLIEKYPQRAGIETYAVWGDDHEGWFAQREGIDVGKHAEHKMREAGREDWHDLGFMEAHVRLVNANTGAEAILAVVHPGGGSAYALSYSIQKIIEALEGGEKPAVALYGHYHKLMAMNIRNVWTAQTGTTEDQTIFMRKKRLSAHVGGLIVGLEQDPETGAITAMTPQMFHYFNRDYYKNRRWGYTGKVRQAKRVP